MKKFSRNILIAVASLLAIAVFTCCGGWWWVNSYHDITGNPRYPTDYKRGARYLLKQQVFIEEDTGSGTPSETNLWLNPRDDPPHTHFGILTPGTHLQFEKMVHREGIDASSTVPLMRVMDGPFSGKVLNAGGLGKDIDRAYHDPNYLTEDLAK